MGLDDDDIEGCGSMTLGRITVFEVEGMNDCNKYFPIYLNHSACGASISAACFRGANFPLKDNATR